MSGSFQYSQYHSDFDHDLSEKYYLESLKCNPLIRVYFKILAFYLNNSSFVSQNFALTGQSRFLHLILNCSVTLYLLCRIGFPLIAERCFLLAIKLNTDHPKSHSNLGNLLVDNLQPSKALSHLETGSSDGSMATLNLSLCRLLLGDYSRGWHDYESRFDALAISSPINGPKVNSLDSFIDCSTTIFVWHEQGLGDSIMFARYLCMLDCLDISWIFACPSSLLPLRDWLDVKGQIVDLDDVMFIQNILIPHF